MILQRTHELPTPAPLSSKSLPLVFFPRSFRPLFSPSFPSRTPSGDAEAAGDVARRLGQPPHHLRSPVANFVFFFCSVFLFLFLPRLGTRGPTDELVHEKEKYKSIADEMDTTFAELAGY